jgi:tetratricopeptide (TPR) repeat protein
LRLAFWPSNLAIDYSGWPVVREWSAAVAPGLVVLTLLGATFGLLLRRSAAALPALLFFAVLAPSSSFIPLTGERLAEHRMYLPLAALVALCVPGVLTFSQRRWPARGRVVAAALLLASAAPLAWATVRRNADYRSELGIWEDTLRKYPENARAQDYIASLLLAQGRYAEALPHAEEALRLDPELSTVDSNLATILMQLGERERAVHHFRRAERYCSGSAIFHGNFGVVLGQSGALDEALQHLRRALLLDPGYLTPRRNLGILLAGAGRTREALPHLQQVLAAQEDPELMLLVIPILAGDPDSGLRDGALALRLAQNLVALAPRDPRSHDSLGMAYAELRRFEEAVQAAERCLEGAAALGQARFEAEVRARLELYRARRPYRTQARD